MKKIDAFKATDKDIKCRDFQYDIGKEFVTTNEISLCSNGFHACEFPLDVLNYYPFESRFFKVKMSGKIIKGDDKTVSSKIRLESEIDIKELFKLSFNKIIDICSKYSKKSTSGDSSHTNTSGYRSHTNTSGDRSHANTSGYSSHANTSGCRSHANTSGDRSHANTSGYSSHANTSGDMSISCSVGFNSRAKIENETSWIVLSDWVIENGKIILNKVISAKCGDTVLDKIIKINHWYWFENGILFEEINNGPTTKK